MALTPDEIRELAENDLYTFACLINPHRVYGEIHKRLFDWWTREEARENQLALLPRDHQKSHCVAVRVVWDITRNPAETFLYVSATSALAEKQLYAIKKMMTSPIYQRYWPEMLHPDEGKREKWSSTEIAVDHPIRTKEGVRDSTVLAAGLTTNTTGFHCTKAVLDDVVVPMNVSTQEGRDKVEMMYSQLSSIETTEANEYVVGTRYDPRDLYGKLLDMEEEVYDEDGEIAGKRKVYEVFEEVVEDSVDRDGSGQYLWPRQRRKDGKYFGFDKTILARKRAKYTDRYQFFAQYYNDPNDAANAPIRHEWFQYYDKKFLTQEGCNWYVRDKKLNIIAAMDFAFSVRKRADFTTVVVAGMDDNSNIYVLDIDRFKTDSIREMFEHVIKMYERWDFRKLRAEVSISQKPIVKEFRNLMSDVGVFFSIDEYRPTRHDGTKEERIDAALTSRYENQRVWHYKGGNVQLLEDELIQAKPQHDDIKDALASAVNVLYAPSKRTSRTQQSNVIQMSRFGGIANG